MNDEIDKQEKKTDTHKQTVMKKYEKRTKIVKCKYKMCHAMSYGERAIETNGYDRKEMVNIYINIWFRFISTTIPNIAPVTYDFQIVQLSQ